MLSDPEKRQIYDEYGEDGLKEGMGGGGFGGGNPFDIFENLFGGGGPFGGGGAWPASGKRGALCSHGLLAVVQAAAGAAAAGGGGRARTSCTR